MFEPAELAALRAEFRWLQQATGDARDLDVYVLGFDVAAALVPESMRADLEPLLSVLRGRRLIARREMTHALRARVRERVRSDWEHLLATLVEQPAAGRPYSKRPIGEIASRRIRKVYRRMLEMGAAIDSDSPPEDYHELRKKGKELRYLLELFGVPLHDAEGRQADDQDAQGAAGRARPPPGPRGPDRDAACADATRSRRCPAGPAR